jgi:hypothetical protein
LAFSTALTHLSRATNGHGKVKDQGVCVNPTHYRPLNYTIFSATLFEALEELGLLLSTDGILHALKHIIQPNSRSEEEFFLTACQYLRLVASVDQFE